MKELELYKVYVSDSNEDCKIAESIKYGFITTKSISAESLLEISQYYSRNKLDASSLNKTLFTRSELENASTFEKIAKQISHYYSDGVYGTQNIEFEGVKFTYDIIKIVSKEELFDIIKNDIYSSKPLSYEKVAGILELVNKYKFIIEFDKLKNNEFKAFYINLANVKIDKVSGDDVIRTIVYLATGNTLLIKSDDVISKINTVASNEKVINLLNMYSFELSQVFNRHKKLFLALKNYNNSSIINKISKMSKKNHRPIIEGLNKIFISKYIKMSDYSKMFDSLNIDLPKLTSVDKMKLLNHIDVLLSDFPNRVFLIRNGKAHIKEETLLNKKDILNYIYGALKSSLVKDLRHLNGAIIKYPKNIDYAFPISEKKSVSGIPFGTVINSCDLTYLVAGMYWENSWGAGDLDLSSVSINGSRIGWGQISSYSRDILFSGDITDARNGAIEYIANNSKEPVILINNIYSGDNGSKFKIVVGNTNIINKGIYIDNPIVELEYKFNGSCKNMSIGALTNDKFILYPVSLGSKSVSSKKDKAILPHVLVKHMSVKDILELSGAKIVYDNSEHDIDLSYESITFDKLTNLFNNKVLTNKFNMV